MKKLLTILTVSFAFVAFTTTVNAQSATSVKENKTSFTTSDKTNADELNSKQKADIAGKQAQMESEKAATPATTRKEAKTESTNDLIKQYEQKIELNRNNPKFDVKAAEAELARLRKEASGK